MSDPYLSSERPPGAALWNATNFYQSITPKRYLVRTSIYKISSRKTQPQPALFILQNRPSLHSDPYLSSESPPGAALSNVTNFNQSITPKNYLLRTSIYKYCSRKTQPQAALLIWQNRSRSISDPYLSPERPPGVALWNATNFNQSITPNVTWSGHQYISTVQEKHNLNLLY